MRVGRRDDRGDRQEQHQGQGGGLRQRPPGRGRLEPREDVLGQEQAQQHHQSGGEVEEVLVQVQRDDGVEAQRHEHTDPAGPGKASRAAGQLRQLGVPIAGTAHTVAGDHGSPYTTAMVGEYTPHETTGSRKPVFSLANAAKL